MTNKDQENQNNLKNEIIDALREVYDPEIPINVYDLGLIYNISVKESGFIHITMSLTSPTCPTAEYIQEMISSAVSAVQGVTEVEIELTFEPRWTPDRVSDDAKEELGIGASDTDKKATMDPAITNVFGEADKNTKKENICVKCMVPDTKVPLLKTTFNNKEKLFCLNCMKTF
jgi:FeS assembly SUF system protein